MTRILLVGYGRMGGAVLDGWLAQGFSPENILIVSPDIAEKKLPDNIRGIISPSEIPDVFQPDVVFLAVKPQVMIDVVRDYRHFQSALFLSIAAGKKLSFFAEHLGNDIATIRAMPNTPSAVRRGMTVAIINPHVTDLQKNIANDLLAAVGSIIWVRDESIMDAVTAVSGSGPAYFFLMTEALAAAGCQAGLSDDIAKQLANATLIGAGELLNSAKENPEILRANVTSPGGTTAAAIDVLKKENALFRLIDEAVQAATSRSQQLSTN